MNRMCANCEHRGKQFTSGYSGKEMTVCKLTGKSRFSFQDCPSWEHYKKEERA